MGYSRHCTMDELDRIWDKERFSEYGVRIGDDLLIMGKYLKTELSFYGFEFEDIDFESEYIDDFSEDGFYVFHNLAYGSYTSISEVLDYEDLGDYYYND